jgi:hypothetical protein
MFQQPMTTKGLMSGFYCTTCRDDKHRSGDVIVVPMLQPDGCLWERVGEGWSEPAATNAPVQDEAVQALLRMNPNTSSPPSPGIFIFLFPCSEVFQPSYLPQSFLLLPTSPTLNPKPTPTLNLNSFSPLHSKCPWSTWVVECCGVLKLWNDVECLSCGALKLWSVELCNIRVVEIESKI